MADKLHITTTYIFTLFFFFLRTPSSIGTTEYDVPAVRPMTTPDARQCNKLIGRDNCERGPHSPVTCYACAVSEE